MIVSRSGAARFARRVSRRHRPGRALPRPADRVFRGLGRGPQVTVVRRSIRLALTPTYAITVGAPAEPQARSAASSLVVPDGRRVPPPLARGLEWVRRLTVERETMSERRVLTERVSSLAPPMLLATTAGAETTPAPPRGELGGAAPVIVSRGTAPTSAAVPRVLRRTLAGDPASPSSPGMIPSPARSIPGETSDIGWGPPIGAARATRPLAEISGPELDRLTDHVMRTLDRRVAAYRERHGRR